MGKRLTKDEWVVKCQNKHGEIYNYSETMYSGCNEKVEIFCNKHSIYFTQVASHHQYNTACSECVKEAFQLKRKYSLDTFTEKAIPIHGDNYKYIEIRHDEKKYFVKMICKKHNHTFEQNGANHLSGKGCKLCSNDAVSKAQSHTIEDFIQNSISKYGDIYDFSESIYSGSNTNIKIKCIEHNHVFLVTPHMHLSSSSGCDFCNNSNRSSSKLDTRHSFIEKAVKVHGNNYDYSLVHYKNHKTDVEIRCIKHNHIFLQKPFIHLRGQGCNICSNKGFKKNIPAILYYITIGDVYKIGITNRDIQKRYAPKDIVLFDNIEQWEMLGKDAYDIEQYLLKHNKDKLYKGDPILTSGNTELFSENIIDLILEQLKEVTNASTKRN